MLNDELLLTRREIVVRGPITDQSANETVAKMLYLQHVNPTASITLHIHSPGGALTAGLAICDTMDIVRPAVHIRCHSIVFGVAAIIAAHGTPGERIAAAKTNLGIVESSCESDEPSAKQEITRANTIMIEMLSNDTGLSPSHVAELMQLGGWIGARKALKLGFVDAIDDGHLEVLS